MQVVYTEFYEQGDQERLIGVDPKPLWDRDKSTDLPKQQLAFIDFVCLPVYRALAQHFPSWQVCAREHM